MKLAEALQERSDINQNIERLKERLRNSVLVQEGEKPAESPKELLKELNESIDRLSYLVSRINKTNTEVKIGKDTLTDIIAKKDALLIKVESYRNMLNEAVSISDRVRGAEIKLISTINVPKFQKEVDDISKEIRLLDNKLQEKNWTTDLIE